MTTRVTSWLSRPALLRTLVSHVRLATRLIREPGVPMLFKGLPFLAALYVISPIDAIPDVLPVLGQLDDLGVVLLVVEGFLKLCPPGAVGFHRAAIAAGRKYSPMPASGQVFDAEFHHDE